MSSMRDRLREESKIIRKEFRDRMLGFITGAMGLVAGLAWNDAVKSLIEFIFPLGKNSVSAKFIYAATISLVVVLLTILLMRWLQREEKDDLKIQNK